MSNKHKQSSDLAFRTENACEQLTRYAGSVASDKLASALEAFTDVNDNMVNGMVNEVVLVSVEHTKRLLDEAAAEYIKWNT